MFFIGLTRGVTRAGKDHCQIQTVLIPRRCLPNTSSKYPAQFLQKLREKNQTDAQQKQAGHAISLYLDMMRTTPRLQSISGCPAGGQTYNLNSFPPEEGKRFKVPQQTATDETKPPFESAEVIRQPLIFKQYSSTGTMKTQWQEAIAEMTAVIKTKHYSVKTLKSYSHWVWKFQSYRKDTNPLSLGSEEETKSPLDF